MKLTFRQKRKISSNRYWQHKKSLLKYTELRCDFITYFKAKRKSWGFVSMEQMNDVWGYLLKS
jgi:hypothetical protein